MLTLKGHKRGVWDVEFSPVDQCVLTTSGDKTIKIWALSDGSCLKTFEGHTASVLKCAFLTCGTQLISAGRVSSLLLCEHTQAYTSLCLLIAMSMWSFSTR